MEKLRGKVAVVTGGGSGIGRAAAVVFARRGVRVVIGNRREALGQQTVDLIKDVGGEAVFHKTDVSNAGEVRALIQRAVDTYGQLDIAFNNAGVLGAVGALSQQDEANFDCVFSINVKGVFLSMKYEIEQMLKQSGGTIVNNISIHGFRSVMPGFSIYTATKHAVVALTKAAALEYARSGIRINAVAPGPTRTDMLINAAGGNPEPFAAALPMKRLGTPADVANAALWLCSDAAAFVTGHVLAVDGGFLAQ